MDTLDKSWLEFDNASRLKRQQCANGEYDCVGDAAELEWKEGVKSGQLPDDFDAEEQFVAARIVAEVSLPEDCAREANEQQEMLRSLQIPMKWLVSYGLVQWTPSA